MSKTFCLHPFVNLNSNTEGSVKLCCSITENIHAKNTDGSEFNFGTNSIEEIWYSDYMVDIRSQLLKGEKPKACDVCWRLEDLGIQSSRQSAFAEYNDIGIKRNSSMHSRPPLPNSLELRLGNFCNLRCNSCWSLSSDRIHDERMKILDTDHSLPGWIRDEWTKEVNMASASNMNWWQSKDFDNTIQKLAPTLKRLYLTGGEPTLIRRNIEIMNIILRSGNDECYVALTTNLTHWSEDFYDTLTKFKNGEVQISIDSVYDRNEYIRFPTKWDHVEKNINKLWYKLPHTWKIKHYTVLQNYNYDDIPQILDWVVQFKNNHKEQNLLYIWSPIVLDNPPYLDIRIVDRQVRQEAADRLKNYDPHYDNLNLYWNHGVEQAIKLLESDAMEEKKRQKLLSRFREFNDTMDRNRNTNWISTFPNIAAKVLV
tara:strand:- start:3518 stop:4795 length:1278 start_codon:yes stop_codon:yes gene_type:complete